MWEGFKKFLLRSNMVDLAIGVVIGSAFQSTVNALVKDLIAPLISVFIRKRNLSELSFTIRNSEFLYGEFISTLTSFFISAAVVYFLIAVPINKFTAKHNPQPTTKKCPHCSTMIPSEAIRCPNCTSEIGESNSI